MPAGSTLIRTIDFQYKRESMMFCVVFKVDSEELYFPQYTSVPTVKSIFVAEDIVIICRIRYYTFNVWSRGKQLVLFSRDSRENRTKWFPEEPDIKCFVVYLVFTVNNRSKTSGAGNNCGIRNLQDGPRKRGW